MPVDPIIQAEFERNLAWKRSWPRCFLGFLTTIEVFVALVIFLTELCNIMLNFWSTNVFGGFWGSIILFINEIAIYSTVCCSPTIGASTCALVWNIVTIMAMGALIAFDVIFILNPSICLLTPTCTTQQPVSFLTYIISMIPIINQYHPADLKKIMFEIQVGCAGGAALISLIYIITYAVCRAKVQKCVIQNYSGLMTTPSAPTQNHIYPTITTAPPMQWMGPPANAPYAPN